MSGPTNDQRRVLASIVGRQSLGKSTFAFLSKELGGLEPRVYQEDFLDDLVLLEAGDEENDLLERFGVRSVLRVIRAFGGCRMVSFRLFCSCYFSSSLFYNHSLVFPPCLPLLWNTRLHDHYSLISSLQQDCAYPSVLKKVIRQEDIESNLGGNLAIVDGQVYQYSKRTYSAANRIIGAMSSAVVPMASIVTLYAIQSPNVRLGLVCVFALVFCLLLSLLTKARRIEVFAATAA